MTSVISFPQVLGHELVGVVDRVGPGVKHRRVGERVVLNPWLSRADRAASRRFTLPEFRDAFRTCREQGRSGAIKVLFT